MCVRIILKYDYKEIKLCAIKQFDIKIVFHMKPSHRLDIFKLLLLYLTSFKLVKLLHSLGRVNHSLGPSRTPAYAE